MSSHCITSGCNLLQALRVARELGCTITPVRRTGERRISHPSLRGSVRVNCRRKDAPRQLTKFLQEVAETLQIAVA